MNIFAQRLREMRKLLKFTQTNISEKIGMSTRRYNDLELGKSSPSLNTLIKLADYFGCSIDYLIGRIPEDYFALLKKDDLPKK